MSGWPWERFPDSESVNALCECPVCRQVLRDAVQCEQQHAVCSLCLQGCEGRCPVCRTPVPSPAPARVVRQLVDMLKIRCEKVEEGCTHIGTVADITRHELECDYSMISCPNAGCTARAKPLKMQSHRAECPYELIPCVNAGIGCKEMVRRHGMQEHTSSVCGFVYVLCTSPGCTAQLLRGELPEHLVNTCETATVSCPAEGCTETCLRRDLAAHEALCLFAVEVCPECDQGVVRHLKDQHSCTRELRQLIKDLAKKQTESDLAMETLRADHRRLHARTSMLTSTNVAITARLEGIGSRLADLQAQHLAEVIEGEVIAFLEGASLSWKGNKWRYLSTHTQLS